MKRSNAGASISESSRVNKYFLALRKLEYVAQNIVNIVNVLGDARGGRGLQAGGVSTM